MAKLFSFERRRARWLRAALCLTAVAIGAATARAQDKTDKERRISFTSAVLPRNTSMDVSSQAARAVVREFLQERPNYEISPFVMPAIQGSAMDSGPLMGIASGNPPHAIYVNFRQSSSYINHGFLEPLEVLLARLKSDDPKVKQGDARGNWLADPTDEEVAFWLAKIKERVAGPAWPVVYRKADVQKEGIPPGKHVWAMPTHVLVKALLYRRDVFKEAGLDPNRPPRNWDELMEYARKIKQMEGTYGLSIPSGPSISWGVFHFMVSKGVRYMKQNEDEEWVATFNTPGAAEAIYYICRLVNEPFTANGQTYQGVAYTSVSGQDRGLKWDRGQIGMRFVTLDQELLAKVNPELVGLAPVPEASGGGRGGEINCRMIGCFRGTTPEQKLAVMDYIWFITGERAQEIRTRIHVENGYGRFVNPDLLEKYGYTDILRQVPQGWRDTFQTSLKTGVPEPYGKNTQFIYRKVSEPINWALLQPLLELPKDEAIKRIQQKLDEAVERTNKHTLGRLSPKEWRNRRLVGGLALLTIIVVFVGSLHKVWRKFGIEERALGDRPPLKRFVVAYLMLLPALALVAFWQYGPLAMGAPLALFDYEIVIKSSFVGIDNFAVVLYDPRFWASLFRTFYYVLLVVGLGFWPPIMVAILLDEVPTSVMKYIFRTVYYLPTIVSGVIMVFLWRQLYDPSESGFFNQILMSLNHLGPLAGTIIKLLVLGLWLSLIGMLIWVVISLTELTWPVRGSVLLFALALLGATLWPLVEAYIGPSELEITAKGLDPSKVTGWPGVLTALGGLVGKFNIKPLGWIEDPQMAMLCVVIPAVWATAGPGCIIYLAALKTVPLELVEAASVDGASILQRFCYITLPRVKFLILIQLVGAIVAAFKGGTNFILAMTGGGPNGATRVLGMDIFERSFMELQYGIGTAMAWVLGAMVIVLTAYQLMRMSRAEFKRAEGR